MSKIPGAIHISNFEVTSELARDITKLIRHAVQPLTARYFKRRLHLVKVKEFNLRRVKDRSRSHLHQAQTNS